MGIEHERLKNVRLEFGWTHAEMADAMHITGPDADVKYRALEAGVGELTELQRNIADTIGADIESDTRPQATRILEGMLPRFVQCFDLSNDVTSEGIVMHTQTPRFYAFFSDRLKEYDLQVLREAGVPLIPVPETQANSGPNRYTWMVVHWIDKPDGDTKEILLQCTHQFATCRQSTNTI